MPSKVSKGSRRYDTTGMFPIDEKPESEDHILMNDIEINRKEAFEKAKQYIPKEASSTFLGRQAGIIAKQRLQELPEDDSDPSNFG